MSVCSTRRLQRRRAITVDYFDDQATEGTAGAFLSGPRVVVGQRREVDSQIESLTAAGTNQPRTAGRAGDQLGRTDSRDEG